MSRAIPFEVSQEFLWNLFQKQNGQCSLTGLKLNLPCYDNQVTMRTASLDRIDSTKPYTQENVQWVHKHINLMKQNFNETHFKEFCKLVANKEQLNHYQG